MKLRDSIPESMCITRTKKGRGFQFIEEDGKLITDAKLKSRCKNLVIPPMWTEVQICKWSDGHIQAIGRDAKGRKQYIYHNEWEKQQQEEKFDRLKSFGERLPGLRKKVDKDLKIKIWNREKVLALMINILDETGIRIGNAQYAKRNGTYGLSTLRRKHIEIEGDSLIFHYKGKSNKEREVEINDADLVKLIKKCAELPGYELFRFKVNSRNFESIDSDDVNEYIRSVMGEEFSSKDFRTWVASRLAIELYPDAVTHFEGSKRKKFTNILIRMVADELGNTPSVCKDYYIHPKVMRKISSRALNLDDVRDDAKYVSKSEKLLLKII